MRFPPFHPFSFSRGDFLEIEWAERGGQGCDLPTAASDKSVIISNMSSVSKNLFNVSKLLAVLLLVVAVNIPVAALGEESTATSTTTPTTVVPARTRPRNAKKHRCEAKF